MHQAAVPWIVEARVDARIGLPAGEVVTRDECHTWLWERAAGLMGIDEGGITVERAADLCRSVARPDGEFVLSGLLAADAPDVADLFAELAGRRPVVSERGDWRCPTFGSA